MSPSALTLCILALMAVGYVLGRRQALAKVGDKGVRHLHSRPTYYGALTALWCGIPALILLAVWIMVKGSLLTSLVMSELPSQYASLSSEELNLVVNDVRNVVAGNVAADSVDPFIASAATRYESLESTSKLALTVLILCVSAICLEFLRRRIHPGFRARNHVEKVVLVFLILSSSIAIFTTVGIVLSVLFEAIRFFQAIPITDFLFGLKWSPQTAIRADQVGASGAFGAVPLFTGTLMISAIAMLVSVPVGLMSAIYLAEYASPRVRSIVKPLLEILAGIPTVVYGFFAALTVAPLVREIGESLGFSVASESALAAGLVMGVMIIPFVSSLSDDVINSVPQSLRDGAFALGATQSETVRQVIIPRRIAWHRRRCATRRIARDRRDHDRCNGRGSRGESQRESVAGSHHRHRPNGHTACWRPRVRQP